MASCSSEPQNPKGLNSTVGRLVWVRRRNGSWWPGQVLDSDENKSSGFPIKLLGRDDVNVDWYNLEDTKQVKEFRCGDHKSCIKKAKASQAKPSKRRLKRSQRENAIILALALETALMSKDCDNNSCGAGNSDSEPRENWSKASPAMSYPSADIGSSRDTSSSKEISDSAPGLSHPGFSLEEANAAGVQPEELHDKVKRKRTLNHSKDDDSEGTKKRTRGLDDLGVGSNMMQLTGLVTESAPQGPSSLGDLCPFNRLPIRHIMNGSRGVCMSYIKKKRSKVVFQEILERKNSCDMLTKVFQSKTLVSVPIIYDELPSPCKSSYYDEKVSGFESKRSVSDAILCYNADDKKNSDSIRVSCQNISLENASEQAQDPALISNKLKDYDISSMPELLGYDSSDNLFDVLLISEEELSDVVVEALTNEAQIMSGSTDSDQEIEEGPLEWQSKGKRNPRHQTRNLELDCKKPTDSNDNSNDDLSDPDDQLNRYEIPEPSITHKYYAKSVLYDVHIEVEASDRPQHVPSVSLMSKLNRKPVIGHPIAVDVLEHGACDFFLDTKKYSSSTKKTRTLSSLSGPHSKPGSGLKEQKLAFHSLNNPPTLACIPIKVLFSRIDEALNGSSWTVNRVS